VSAPTSPISAGERALGRLLADAHLASADELPGVVAQAAAELGAVDVDVLLVDYEQRHLRSVGPGPRGELSVDGTLAGRAFRQSEVQQTPVEGGQRLWLPMLDGLERIGILGLTVEEVDAALLARTRRLASLTAELVLSKSTCSDTLQRVARRREMSLAAEMQWELMPPLTAGTSSVSLAAMLEPAYEVGGDIVDYALDDHVAHVAIFDAMGHGLQASLCSSLAVGAYRNRRRSGDDLAEMAQAVEDAVAGQFGGDRFVTAILARLDTDTGELRWINAGHPPPLLLRAGQVIKELFPPPAAPLGLSLSSSFTIHSETLEPADRLLLYTDGVVDVRPPGGELFGVERLVDFVVRADASGEVLAETMRRLSHALLEHHGGALRDDASQLLVEWQADGAQRAAARFAGETLA
jgi:serine phosphatase RsbU (regulator of sigma subunit)